MPPRYRPKDRKTLPLFPELFPLGGGLNAGNRWIKLSGLIPWERLEEAYRGYFSEGMGRPAKDSRPIVRGKAGRNVEFRAKCLLSWVDGFCFLDKLGFDAYNEGEDLADSLESYKERFGHYPASSTGDGIFGSRANREHLKEIGVRGGFKTLGRGAAVKETRA